MSNLLHSTRSAKLMALAKTCVDKNFVIPNTRDGVVTLTLRQHLVDDLVTTSSTIKEATALMRSTTALALDDVSVLTSSSGRSISLVAREVHEFGQSKLAALREQILEQLYARTTPACAREQECEPPREEAVFADPMSDPRTPRNLKTFARRPDARVQARDCSRGERQSPFFCRRVDDEDKDYDVEADAEYATVRHLGSSEPARDALVLRTEQGQADVEQASIFPTPCGHNLADYSTATPTTTTMSLDNGDSCKTQASNQEPQSPLPGASRPTAQDEVHNAWASLSGRGTTNKQGHDGCCPRMDVGTSLDRVKCGNFVISDSEGSARLES
ncbi:hypothetical protein V8E36_005129 [Tilletia maclaganii]